MEISLNFVEQQWTLEKIKDSAKEKFDESLKNVRTYNEAKVIIERISLEAFSQQPILDANTIWDMNTGAPSLVDVTDFENIGNESWRAILDGRISQKTLENEKETFFDVVTKTEWFKITSNNVKIHLLMNHFIQRYKELLGQKVDEDEKFAMLREYIKEAVLLDRKFRHCGFEDSVLEIAMEVESQWKELRHLFGGE